jgi:prepilin-type N-terminal cleavage/methylation domain-containing protein
MFELKNKKGFTLIELLIVMSIVAILAGLAIGGYTAFRKMALIDLNADLLVSQINEMRAKAIHGTGAVKDEILKCYGVKFDKNTVDAFYKITAFAQNFSGMKSWNPAAMKWEYTGCEGEGIAAQDVQVDPMVIVENIYRTDDLSSNTVAYTGQTFELRFLPPDGQIEIKAVADYEHDPETGDNKVLIKLRYGSGEDNLYTRNVLVDLSSGKASKY